MGKMTFFFNTYQKCYRNERTFKGASLLKFIDEYIAIDTETTGLYPTTDELIEIAAVHIKDGEIISQFQSLIKPSREIDDFIIKFTGITNEMVQDAPLVSDILPSFLDFVGNHIIVGHNVHFDINFIYDSCINHLKRPFSNDLIDNLRLSRALFDFHRHKLSDLIKHFDIEGNVAHRALSDAIQTHLCYEYMKNYAKTNGIKEEKLRPSSPAAKLSAKEITTQKTEFNKNNPIYDNVVVFTGALDKFSRTEAMQIVADLGGICADSLTKKTNFLVLGSNDYNPLIKDGKSSKHKKAEEYKLKGCDIEIIPETVFYEMIFQDNDDFINED